jgi:hypothetical protein
MELTLLSILTSSSAPSKPIGKAPIIQLRLLTSITISAIYRFRILLMFG